MNTDPEKRKPAEAPPEKLSGGLPDAPEDLHDVDDALDEALAESFPASDPIAPPVPDADPKAPPKKPR